MADWKKYSELLGEGTIESAGGRAENDPQGRTGSVIVRRNLDTGMAIFEVVLDRQTNPNATNAEIKTLEVEGFEKCPCEGTKKCAQFRDVSVDLIQPENGNAFFYEPSAHDNGILSTLIARCGCTTKDVRSFMVYVGVEVTQAAVTQLLRFKICYCCQRMEISYTQQQLRDI